jgi:hypothetical protein
LKSDCQSSLQFQGEQNKACVCSMSFPGLAASHACAKLLLLPLLKYWWTVVCREAKLAALVARQDGFLLLAVGLLLHLSEDPAVERKMRKKVMGDGGNPTPLSRRILSTRFKGLGLETVHHLHLDPTLYPPLYFHHQTCQGLPTSYR